MERNPDAPSAIPSAPGGGLAFVRYNASVSSIEERRALHQIEIERLTSEHAREESHANRISLFRLVTFLSAVVAVSIGIAQGRPLFLLLFVVLAVGFFLGVVLHARTLARMHILDVKRAVHQRHVKRMLGTWSELELPTPGRLPAEHPYASDIDLSGPGSLIQRIDVSQTLEGEQALFTALGEAAEPTLIRARQLAVEELFCDAPFRQELETLGALHQLRGERLDHRPFMKLFARPSLFRQKRWLWPTMLVVVSVTLVMVVLSSLDLVPSSLVWLCAFVQAGLLWSLRETVHETLDLVTARLGFAKAYEGMLRAIEAQRFQAPHLLELQGQLTLHGTSASQHLARLSRYEGFAQLRTQGPLYIVLNVLTLWDLFCLERIEHFARTVGPDCERWFEVVGKLEMLCSLATLRHAEESTSYPALEATGAGISALGLAHPLLPRAARVGNDLQIAGPGSVLIVTGSNMAGKSTLLRALGLNVALALAGGPVCARELRLPVVRLRASMRIDDSLQRGASYFHAELSRLRMVVSELSQGAPVLFLLDELLRGTNARARHQGARAVLLHLLKHDAMGIVATHDIALSELSDELPGKAANVHFTDVFEHGEMLFDYKLREGVVKTSNALRLLSMAGIEVEVDDALA